MPHPNAINPATGKRYSWEAEQRRLKDADIEVQRKAVRKEIALLERAQKAQEARERFMTFIKFTSPDPEDPNDVNKSKYKNARHHDAIARVIEEVVEGNIPFLILTCPPRHGKSEIVSRRLPAWFMGRFPHMHGVVATYNDDFAADFGKDVRNIVKTPQFRQVFPNVALQRGGAASDRLQTMQGGQWSFVGAGGSLTGRGAHVAIVDDIIKDDKEAQSQAIRDQRWSWFTKVLMSRRMGMKLVIMTFTRWHADDPIGRLTDPENPHYNRALAEKIKIINLPAIAEEDDPLGREVGEPLWADGPDRFDLDFLKEQQALDPLGFAALYQQRPSLLDGDLFKRETINFYKPGELPKDLRIYAASDHAVATGQRNDFTVLLKVGVDPQNNIYLLDCVWAKIKSDVAVERILDMCRGDQRPLLWWAEKGHISKSIGPFLRKRMAETGVYINIREVTPVADKAQRAQSIAGRVAMGKVYFPLGATWTEKALNEMMAFPNGTHDDFCLSAGTPVTMADGSRRRIDSIRAGDAVLTRKGPRQVLAASMTSLAAKVFRVTFSDGRELVATGGHPVFVDGRGFVRVDALLYDDVVFDERQITIWRGLTPYALWRLLGMPVTKAGSGTRNMAVRHGASVNLSAPPACAAAPSEKHSFPVASNTAIKTAARVMFVEVLTTPQPVYNLAVEGENEFFANGVLTHNCDALAYIGLGLQSQFAPPSSSAKKRAEQPKFGTLAWVKLADKWAAEQRAAQRAGGF